jgi:NAD(P)-dependent dehydrogenase (short-subunit alcohol dehydrogenase family)
MDLELGDKRAIVTGGSRGIGKAVARRLAEEGAAVGIASLDPTRVRDAAAELTEIVGRRVVGCAVDTRDDASVHSMVTTLAEALGGVDILVNAAAIPGGRARPKFADVTADLLWDEVNTKVMGYLRCAREVVPYMEIGGWGRIVNVSGLAARQTGSIIGSVRNVSVAAMTKNLADELGGSGINVTVVHPGATRTEATTEELVAVGARNTIGRIVESDEVADVVVFLASPRSAAITGDAIACGGGTPRQINY